MFKSNKMITEEEFNEKPIKDNHPKRHHTYIYWRD